jgi:hypothetical protein
VLEPGVLAGGASRHDERSPLQARHLDNYHFGIGFLPGLELGGRIAEDAASAPGIRDLSFNAKASWRTVGGLSLAVGGQDIGGEAQHFRAAYVLATLPLLGADSPAGAVALTAGHGFGPDVLDGALGGVEWRPWRFVSLIGEYDAESLNGGLRLGTGDWLGRARLSFTVGYRGDDARVEYGAALTFPLAVQNTSKKGQIIFPPEKNHLTLFPEARPLVEGTSVVTPESVVIVHGEAGFDEPPPRPEPDLGRLRAALQGLGFESVHTGWYPDGTLVVVLEDRRYNHSSADGLGLALGTVREHAPGQAFELVLQAYGVPQLRVAESGAPGAAPRFAYVDGIRDEAAIRWVGPPSSLEAVELVIEPLLRTFVATERGVLDYALAARGRMTAPLGYGLLFNMGARAPVARSDDMRGAGAYAPFAPRAGLDLATLQFFHKPAPAWAWLWSAGHARIVRADLRALALEQLWLSGSGRHQLRAKLMSLSTSRDGREVVLGGYRYFDPVRAWSAGITGGRFYEGDAGVRLDLERHFGDVIAGVFWKAASADDQAAGFALSLPLTPRRDMAPRGVQVKGPRRWGHSLASTLNDNAGRNPLRPLLLFEPSLDLDLARDLYDSGRLGPAYLEANPERLREAHEQWKK